MHNDSKLIYEAFTKVRENVESLEPGLERERFGDRRETYNKPTKNIYLLINDTQYEFDVYGIYSTREMAEQKMAEFGKDKNLAVLERPLDSEPNFYYSDSQYGEEN